MAMCFWYLVKSGLSSVHVYRAYTEQFIFTSYQKNMAMFIQGCFFFLKHELLVGLRGKYADFLGKNANIRGKR